MHLTGRIWAGLGRAQVLRLIHDARRMQFPIGYASLKWRHRCCLSKYSIGRSGHRVVGRLVVHPTTRNRLLMAAIFYCALLRSLHAHDLEKVLLRRRRR